MARRPEVIAGVAAESLAGETVLVTGSTRGIGREIALALGRMGARVFVHGRDREAGQRVLAALSAADCPPGEFVQADFADRAAVASLAAKVRDETDTLDVLINNAGLYVRSPGTTAEGVEYTFAVNHLGPFCLTRDLLDVVRASDRARVVTTASGAHHSGSLDLDRLTESTSGWAAYSRSKLANVLFTRELARRAPDVSAYSFHPGFVPGSGFLRHLPGPLSGLGRLLGRVPLVGTSVQEGAATGVFLAAASTVPGDAGDYFADCAPATPSATARDDDLAARLWDRSVDFCVE